MEQYLVRDPRGKDTREGNMYYLEFRSKFWLNHGKYVLLIIVSNLISVNF